MALAWLVSPQKQFMTRSGTINAAGYLRVFDAATDDTVVTYSNFSGGENPELVQFDSDGRANVIADDSRAYRIEVYDRYGSLLWTASPVWCMTTGGGVTATQVISSDRSVAVTRTAVGGTVQYDLSTRVGDSTDLLEWISCSGDSEFHDGAFHLEYNAGTMETGERGIRLYAKRYYHVTAEVAVGKDGVNPVYDNVDFVLYFRDGEGDLEEVAKFARVGDYSMGLSQCWTVACDCMPDADVELVLRIEGKDLVEAGSFAVTRFDVHRVFSGAPALPGGAVSKDMLEEGLAGKQDTLIAGDNITIEGNVISATGGGGGGGGTTYTAGEGINIQDDEISVDTDVIQEKLTAGSNITISGNTISASAAPQVNADWDANSGVAQILNRPNLATVATTGSYNDLSNKPSLATVATSGSYNDLSNKPTIPAAQVQADWGQENSGAVDFVKRKPAETTLVAGSNITLTESGNTLTISASGGGGSGTVDQTYDSTSTNAQSGTAVAEAVGGKADLVSGATSGNFAGLDGSGNLTDSGSKSSDFATSSQGAKADSAIQSVKVNGSALTPDANKAVDITVPAAQVNADWEANSGVSEILNRPDLVDIVAGPGIVVDNPDGNTLRVSVAQDVETVLWEQSSYTYGITSVTLSENYHNFETIKIFTNKGDVILFHPGNSQTLTGVSLTHFSDSNIWVVPWSFTDDTHFAGSAGKMYYPDSETSTLKYTSVTSGSPYGRWEQPEKIVGVHRIAGGN